MKIDDEKVIALHNAGFPVNTVAQALSQLKLITPIEEFKHVFPNAIEIEGVEDDYFLPPNLEQVFAALEDNLTKLERVGSSWSAVAGTKTATGTSPLDALVNLFLALHEN